MKLFPAGCSSWSFVIAYHGSLLFVISSGPNVLGFLALKLLSSRTWLSCSQVLVAVPSLFKKVSPSSQLWVARLPRGTFEGSVYSRALILVPLISSLTCKTPSLMKPFSKAPLQVPPMVFRLVLQDSFIGSSSIQVSDPYFRALLCVSTVSGPHSSVSMWIPTVIGPAWLGSPNLPVLVQHPTILALFKQDLLPCMVIKKIVLATESILLCVS